MIATSIHFVLLAAATVSALDLELIQVVYVSRHGIRSPYYAISYSICARRLFAYNLLIIVGNLASSWNPILHIQQ